VLIAGELQKDDCPKKRNIVLRIGFIGTGSITKAIVTGLCRAGGSRLEICVSPRNEETATGLAKEFSAVRVGISNQEVVDRSDIVVLAVRPQIVRSVLESLRFTNEHRLISLVATLPYEALLPLVSPVSALTLAAPLPTVEYGVGPTAIYPPNAESATLFARISVPVQLTKQSEYDAIFACTAEMASYFELLRTCSEFLRSKGVAIAAAQRYLGALFNALGHTALSASDRPFQTLVADHMTKGGLNEQVRSELLSAGVFAAHAMSLQHVYDRIRSLAK
jgi:pyrroline-5-carboxylate reductase